MNKHGTKGQLKSALYVFTAGMLWGCMGILVRKMYAVGLTTMEIVAFRSVVTAAVMFVGMLLLNRKALKIRLKDCWCFFGTGIVSVVFFNLCYFLCMDYTTLSTAAILLYTAPAFVMLMSFLLFKERFTKRKVLALFLAFIGCVLVSGGFSGALITKMGLLTGLGAGFGYALYSIFGRYAIKRGYSSLTITTYTFLFASIGSIPFCDVQGLTATMQKDLQLFLFCFMITVLVTVLPYILYTKGLSGIENSKASIIASIEPVMASVVGFMLFSEIPTVTGISGMILVLASTVICCL